MDQNKAASSGWRSTWLELAPFVRHSEQSESCAGGRGRYTLFIVGSPQVEGILHHGRPFKINLHFLWAVFSFRVATANQKLPSHPFFSILLQTWCPLSPPPLISSLLGLPLPTSASDYPTIHCHSSAAISVCSIPARHFLSAAVCKSTSLLSPPFCTPIPLFFASL